MKVMTKHNASYFAQNVNKNLDVADESYWCLKYLFNKRYTDNLKNEQRTKQMIFDILKYIYFIKKPKIHYQNEEL